MRRGLHRSDRRGRTSDGPCPPAISLSTEDSTLVVTAHAALDAARTCVLSDAIEVACAGVGGPHDVTIDVRRAPFCSPESLMVLARAIERGVRIRTDAVRDDGTGARPAVEVAAVQGMGR